MKTFILILALAAGLIVGLAHMTLAGEVPAETSGGMVGQLSALPAGPVALNMSFEVTDDVVLLGDLFTNTGDQAGKAVAYAPLPGRQATYEAKWLYRVARYYSLDS